MGLLGMYFDAVVVFVKNNSLLARLSLAILWAYCMLSMKLQQIPFQKKIDKRCAVK